jgi:hypothetical protein
MRNKHWAMLILAVMALMLFWAAAAVADPTGGTSPSTGDPLGDLQRMLTAALVTAITGTVVALGKRAWDWLGHSSAGKTAETAATKAQELATKLGVNKLIAAAAIGYVHQMEHVAGRKLTDSEIERHVKEFLASHKVAGDAVDAVRSLIEAQLGVQRAEATAKAKLAANAKKLEDAMATGQLGKDIATLEHQQDDARARMKGDAT